MIGYHFCRPMFFNFIIYLLFIKFVFFNVFGYDFKLNKDDELFYFA